MHSFSSIIYTSHLLRVAGKLEPFPADFRGEAGFTLDRAGLQSIPGLTLKVTLMGKTNQYVFELWEETGSTRRKATQANTQTLHRNSVKHYTIVLPSRLFTLFTDRHSNVSDPDTSVSGVEVFLIL